MELLQLKCPVCHSSDMQHHSSYTTKNHGGRVIYKCDHCPVYFSETKNTFMEGLKTPVSVIWQVLKARTEGMGLNAAARTFEKAKNTILAWERKFVDLHRVLLLYAVVHEFLESVIEGDEAYTKVQKNVPPDQSRGWTILLMDRASRFIWELDCGKKDRRLFKKAIKTLDKIARQTHDLSIFTDGERRYGNLLFEICYTLVNNGKPGRPKKTFKKGVHFRIKNKGSQAHKKGRKRPKYQSPWREHPETTRTIAETDIHANHAEAFFSALRRKCATFRRKTNTYAKSTKGLQRLLHVYWVVHNFLRAHFTTREVPAVALGVLERRLSVREVFHLQMA
jgi:transposase-like protein